MYNLSYSDVIPADSLIEETEKELASSQSPSAHKVLFAVIEAARLSCASALTDSPPPEITVNPTLELVEIEGPNYLPSRFNGRDLDGDNELFLAIWQPEPGSRHQARPLSPRELFAVKSVIEGLSAAEAAEAAGINPSQSLQALKEAFWAGLLVRPDSLIKREFHLLDPSPGDSRLMRAGTFSIQWHITQACDLSCKHCYDRSERNPMPLDKAKAFLLDLFEFTQEHFVDAHVVFTGGNPFLYPHFKEVYKEAVRLGMSTAILGNPVPEKWLDEICVIQVPAFYQISLEGLEEQTDYIRGEGHFRRSLDFLRLLETKGVDSSVMLTLTKDNIKEIIPLAELLRGYTRSFTFNRLSQVGEGAGLALPHKEEFRTFLQEFVELFRKGGTPVYLKDNLANIILEEKDLELFDGCTGFGCGAAFNFLAVLSDGEAHACRKFPSPLGNVFNDGLHDIYHSELAKRYRQGPEACSQCRLRVRCRGCMAIALSHGLDIFKEKDPYCHMTGPEI